MHGSLHPPQPHLGRTEQAEFPVALLLLGAALVAGHVAALRVEEA